MSDIGRATPGLVLRSSLAPVHLAPEASVRTPTLNAELERRFAQLGGPPDTAQLTGMSVTIDGTRIEAELEYTEPNAQAVGDASSA
jgi:hypothetical protein